MRPSENSGCKEERTSEDLRGEAGLGEGSQSARSGVNARETDRKDGDADRRVDEI